MLQQGVEASSEVFVVGYFDNVSFGIFMRFDMLALKALDDNHMAVHARHPRVCTLVVAPPSVELPSAEVRAESARLMRLRAPTQLCSVTVLEGGGFVAAAARGVLTAIQVLSRHAYPLHTAATISAAARWTAERAGRDGLWANRLESAVVGAQQKMGAG
jgi:hypothetical protein